MHRRDRARARSQPPSSVVASLAAALQIDRAQTPAHTMTESAPSPLAAAIALTPGLAARLLAEHVDDGTGRCRRCPLGGQAGHQRWPCRIYDAAYQAVRSMTPGTT
jgi:hypothetical protein